MLLSVIKRKITRLRFRPIRVFVFHQVSECYDPSRMWECDWTEMGRFKHNIVKLKDKYKFISLSEAYKKLQKDVLRFKNYAVLTSDDGYASLKSILPWLEKEQIPVTLFINSKYLDGESWSAINEEQALRNNPGVDMREVVKGMYLTKQDLWDLKSPLLSIGLHGYEHLSALEMSSTGFRESVSNCQLELENHPRYISFFAYTWGQCNQNTDLILEEFKLVPLRVSGQKNYTNIGYIDRECIDGITL